MINSFQIATLCILILLNIQSSFAYNPLKKLNTNITIVELTVDDADRNRSIPILAYIPDTEEPLPVILFSHGLGGSRYSSSFLGRQWASRNYVAIFLQHKGSDLSIWKDKSIPEKFIDAKKAASIKNFKLRIYDVYSVLNQLEKWNNTPQNHFYNRMDTSLIAMSGHSFGAITTQAVSGQYFPKLDLNYTDKRIKAAVIFSPSPPKVGGTTKESFSKVSIPWMLMTGTNDSSPINQMTPEKRLEVFSSLPKEHKYQLVLNNASHFAFSEHNLKRNSSPRNPNHHKAIMAISTAFLDSYLKNDSNALIWLEEDSAKKILEHNDLLQKK